MTNRVRGALCVALAIATGCAETASVPDSGTSSDASVERDASRPPPFVGPSGPTAGCGREVEATGEIDRTITIRGEARRYRTMIPEGYDRAVPHALVLAFHGLGDTAENFQRALRFEQLAEGDAIVVYPHGTYPALGANGWDLEVEGADFELVDALLAQVSEELCIERGRVFATGFSYGAFMTNAVGCHRGDQVRAIGAMAGGPASGACAGQTAAWLVHGEADAVVSYDALGVRARDQWRRRNGCADVGETDANGCVTYDRCDVGYPVVFCTHAGGHVVPAYAPAAIWSFFAALH